MRGLEVRGGEGRGAECSLFRVTAYSNTGGVAQMVERSLSMREVRGSIPRASIYLFLTVQ